MRRQHTPTPNLFASIYIPGMPVSRKTRLQPSPLAFIPFQLPTLAEEAPSGPGWFHEIKQDGYRTQLVIIGGEARAFTRNGLDWTDRYRPLVESAAKLKARSAIIDGEAVVQDENGIGDFHALRSALHWEPHLIVFFAFDLLHLNGEDLRRLPLLERRARLAKLLAGRRPSFPLQFSEAIEGDGREVFAAAEKLGVEGIVSKRVDGRYQSGRSREWLKIKATVEEEFVVIGVEPNPGGPPYALLAREEDGQLVYAGSAFVTLEQSARDRFWRAAEALKISRPVLPEIRKNKVGFLKPELRVRARRMRGEGMVRHGVVTDLLK